MCAPALIMQGTPSQVAMALVTAFVGVILLSAGVMGYFLRHSRRWESGLLLLAAFLLIHGGWMTDLAGVGIGATVALLQLSRRSLPSASEA